jgi:hypothetical protein
MWSCVEYFNWNFANSLVQVLLLVMSLMTKFCYSSSLTLWQTIQDSQFQQLVRIHNRQDCGSFLFVIRDYNECIGRHANVKSWKFSQPVDLINPINIQSAKLSQLPRVRMYVATMKFSKTSKCSYLLSSMKSPLSLLKLMGKIQILTRVEHFTRS